MLLADPHNTCSQIPINFPDRRKFLSDWIQSMTTESFSLCAFFAALSNLRSRKFGTIKSRWGWKWRSKIIGMTVSMQLHIALWYCGVQIGAERDGYFVSFALEHYDVFTYLGLQLGQYDMPSPRTIVDLRCRSSRILKATRECIPPPSH